MATDFPNHVVWIILLLLGVLTIGCIGLAPGIVFSEEPRDLVVVKNSRARLDCSAIAARGASGGGADVNVTWYHDGEQVVADGRRRRLLRNGTLLLHRVSARKQAAVTGEYHCLASTAAGAILSRKATLSVAVLPPFKTLPQSTTVGAGEVAVFRCEIGGVPRPEIRWQKDKQALPLNDRYTTFRSGTLEIQEVVASDAGNYRCIAKNTARTRQSAEAQLTVQPVGSEVSRAVRIISTSWDMTKKAGETVVLLCAATGLPRPSITWTKQGHDSPLVPGDRFSIVGQGSLRIKNLLPSDSGVYVCLAGGSRASGADSGASLQTQLKVLGPPELLSASENMVRPPAFTVRFECHFSGADSLHWTKNGVRVVNNGRVKVLPNELLIPQAATKDTGIYQCWARNQVAEVAVAMRLYIQPSEDAPNPPGQLRGSAISSTMIELSWQASPPKNHLNILAYSVHYLPTEGGAELQKVEADTETVVDQLWPYTSYTFYVVAYNTNSASEHSNKISLRTLEDKPVEAPVVNLMSYYPNTLLINWEPLPPDKARGVVTQYRLFYRKEGSAAQHVVDVAGDTTEHLLQDLEANVKYEVRVAASTAVGFAQIDDKRWPWVSQMISSAHNLTVPAAPSMMAKSLNATAVRIVWTLPKPLTAPILGYKLHVQPQGRPTKTIIFLNDVHSHTLYKLEPNMVYTISLLAFNQVGNGTPTVIKFITNDSHVMLHPPRHLEAEALSSTSIVLHWKQVETVDEISYSVRYEKVDGNAGGGSAETTPTLYATSMKTEYVVADLQPFTKYKFAVSAQTATAHSNYSAALWCRTQESLPSAPRDLRWQLLGPGAVQLRWQPPAKRNGIIVSYVLLYSRNDNQPDDEWARRIENGSKREVLVSELHFNSVYSFKLRAVTSAGQGPSSRLLKIHTNNVYLPNERRVDTRSDREVGIIIGVCVGGGCIIICTVILLLRNRCSSNGQSRADVSYAGVNGRVPRPNGNGHVPGRTDSVYEMDSFLPILTQLHENEQSDTKGGYGISGGGGGIRNGYLPSNGRCKKAANGHVPSGHRPDPVDDPQTPLRGDHRAEHAVEESPLSSAQHSSLHEIDRCLNADDLDEVLPESIEPDDNVDVDTDTCPQSTTTRHAVVT